MGSRRSLIFAAFAAVGMLMTPAAGSELRDAPTRSATEQRTGARDISRIVSIGGAVTEILYELGLQQHIVAVDTTSLYPPEALRTKPNVGYMRQLSPEGVLGLNPSLVLAADGSGPKDALAIIESAGVPLLRVPDTFTGPGIVEKIHIVADAIGMTSRGTCLAQSVETDLAALDRMRARIDRPLRVAFVLSLLNGRAQVAGRGTAADGVIKLAGAVNAISDYDGYKPINDEAIIAAQPDFVLGMQQGAAPLDAATVFAHPAFALTPAAKTRAFLAMDGLYLLGFGPRTALAARDLAATLYPSLQAEKLPSENSAAADGACKG